MRLLVAFALVALTGCTVINTASVPSDRSGRDVFVTAGDIPEPYETLGMVQATRSGVLLFGFVDVIGTDLDAGFKDVLIPQVRAMGGDGAINVRFRQTQYLPVTKVFGAIFFIFPLPSSVTVTAEVVKLQRRADLPAGDGAPVVSR
ncbi:hypothetical protein ATI61_103568 [Archangium gephyra]|uniref:Lipoprotein n=1 Tax=Archangium gephyra TaxID=48 RepID=A0AAC8Q6B5_9BACT|nr:hypothetical protein [Archangium gephyra]AKJ01855.1 Hypothetical protein AA314_03481 [Archangium gephyra]REG34661.1 hypothetical protein ATI61_103568 [Archangium gephyra]